MEKTVEALTRKIFDEYIQNPDEALGEDGRAFLITYFGILVNRNVILNTLRTATPQKSDITQIKNPSANKVGPQLEITPVLICAFKDCLDRGQDVLQQLDIQDKGMNSSRESLLALGEKAGPLLISELNSIYGQQREVRQDSCVSNYLQKRKQKKVLLLESEAGLNQPTVQPKINAGEPDPDTDASKRRLPDTLYQSSGPSAIPFHPESSAKSFEPSEEELAASLEEDLLSLVGRMKGYANNYKEQLTADNQVLGRIASKQTEGIKKTEKELKALAEFESMSKELGFFRLLWMGGIGIALFVSTIFLIFFTSFFR